MPTERSCTTAVVSRMRTGLLLVALALAGCAGPSQPNATLQPSPPKEALAFGDAVDQLTVALFARAKLDPQAAAGRTLVVDPLIDRATGNQAVATQSMERRMVAVVRARFGGIEPRPFNTDTLRGQPLVLVGSITPVAVAGSVVPARMASQTYRIWAALADLRTNRIVSQESAWVHADGVDMTPTRFFRDSPSWVVEPSQAAYIKTCAGKPGEPVDPAYLGNLLTSATISEGIKAYEAGRYAEALTLYTTAQALPSGNQLRVLNGLYLAEAALGRRAQAEVAFGSVVDYGLERGKLAVKLVFQPDSTRFWPDPAVSGAYPMWLRQVAARSTARATCLNLVGHTSPTGSSAANMMLSLARAAVVRGSLVADEPLLAAQTGVEGRGGAEPIVGTGRDDGSDVLDRRVEFETRPCLQASVDGLSQQ